jgi:hypothetical protein
MLNGFSGYCDKPALDSANQFEKRRGRGKRRLVGEVDRKPSERGDGLRFTRTGRTGTTRGPT